MLFKSCFVAPVIVMLSALLFSACGQKSEEGEPPVFVTIAPVKTQAWQNSVDATGTLNAIQGAELKAEVAGRITKIYFSPDQKVRAGDPLIDINPGILMAQLKLQQATEVLQNANFQRAKKLYRQGVISHADFDQAKANDAEAVANVNAAEANLAEAKVKAPFDGTVGISQLNVGSYVNLGDPLVSLEQLDPLRVDFSVPEAYAGKIFPGDKVELLLKDNGVETYVGKVTAIDSSIDQTTRMLAIRATVSNEKLKLLPGGFAQVKLYYGPVQTVMTVPQDAVVNDGDAHEIYLVDKGKAKEVPITVGERFGDAIIIKSGVKPGNLIVTSGLVKLHDGATIIDVAAKPKEPPKK